ncbi:hypothetical protein PROFUN_01839 [Planoprotostelium fungivorum]|uniref:alpha-1,2-Mannosidase n=1 Tax=Planoprotostelium fungivorum TaxID=1890364 RepID=A0A2P6NYV3_9EUKA|nr:hypothetical protein PROFUN_01839 [Planoprotostelium fungivorum]
MSYYDYNANNNNLNYLLSAPSQTASFPSPSNGKQNQRLQKKLQRGLLDLSQEKWKVYRIGILIAAIIFMSTAVWLMRDVLFVSHASEQPKSQDPVDPIRLRAQKANRVQEVDEYPEPPPADPSRRPDAFEAVGLNKEQRSALRQREKEADIIAANQQKQIERSRLNRKRRDAVRNAFRHGINGYYQHAYGFDELRPVSNETNSSWGGFGITLFDSLDTMLLMGLRDEYAKALNHVLKVDFKKDHDASFFEFTIRYVGGCLSAYDLSGDERLLMKAKEMADLLLPAFNSKSGIPYGIVNLKTGKTRNPSWTQGNSLLAEVGSVQLELKYLSHHLKDETYANKAQKVMNVLFNNEVRDGMYPTYVHPDDGHFGNGLISYGGLGDSFYEYILKQHLLGGKKDKIFRDKYDEAVRGIEKHLLVKTKSGLSFIGEFDNGKIIKEMDHLACYVPGMLALGATGDDRESHMTMAESLGRACIQLYMDQATGIGPERIAFDEEGYKVLSSRYLLRPETIESIFVLYRQTGDEEYREIGWKIFQSIERYCKTPSSYSGLLDVTSKEGGQNNSMQSFFFAETLKYLYLLFSEKELLPLDEYVFTTEAHPLRVLK